MGTRLDELEDSRINRDEVELALSRIETFHDSLEAIENKINLFESLNIGEDEIEEILSMKSQLLEMKDIMQNIRSKVPREI